MIFVKTLLGVMSSFPMSGGGGESLEQSFAMVVWVKMSTFNFFWTSNAFSSNPNIINFFQPWWVVKLTLKKPQKYERMHPQGYPGGYQGGNWHYACHLVDPKLGWDILCKRGSSRIRGSYFETWDWGTCSTLALRVKENFMQRLPAFS